MIDRESFAAAIADRYVIERELGRGGMATVYLAREVRLDREVAIKVLHPDVGAAVGAERFRREIQIATQLAHPNILAVYDSGEAAGYLYYVMPFVKGESLRDRLDRERQLPIEDAVRIAVEVANALDYAHRQNIIHRDIKPENILLEDGHAVVADFGVARAVGDAGDGNKLTKTGMAIGTPTYMSPEQALADKGVDARSDQYALACVVYEMLAGSPPFTGASMQTLIMRHAMEPVPSLRIQRQTVAEELEAVIARALSKAPADRWPTLKQFAEALVQPAGVTWTWRTPTMAHPTLGATKPPLLRRPATVVALVAMLIAGAGAAALWVESKSGEAVAAAVSGEKARQLAVMYLKDASPDGRLGFLADGLTEELIGRLSRVEQLDVVSRDGVLPFRGRDVPRDSVAAALDVGTLVTGSIAEDGDQVRVTVSLVDALSGADIETQTFTKPAAEALALRDELATEVAGFLRTHLGTEIRLREERAGTKDAQAWLLVRRAEKTRKDAESLAEQRKRDEAVQAFSTADSLLAEAERRDPAWAEPTVQRSWIAYRRARLAATPADQTRWSQQAIAMAERALGIDPVNSSAHEVRGTSKYFMYLARLIPGERNAHRAFEEAGQDLVAATRDNPRNASAWATLAHYYSNKPDLPQAQLAAMKAYEEDAFMARADDILDRIYQTSYVNQNFTDADRSCSDGRRRFPDDYRFVACRLWLLTVSRVTPDPRPDSAWRLLDSLTARLPESQAELMRRRAQVAVAIVLGRASLADSARRVLVRARATPEQDQEGELLFYEAYARLTLGDRDTAFDLLQQYVARNPEHREGWRRTSAWWWRDIQDDPRFVRIMGGTG